MSAAPSELEDVGGICLPRVYTRGYILCLLQRHNTNDRTYISRVGIAYHQNSKCPLMLNESRFHRYVRSGVLFSACARSVSESDDGVYGELLASKLVGDAHPTTT